MPSRAHARLTLAGLARKSMGRLALMRLGSAAGAMAWALAALPHCRMMDEPTSGKAPSVKDADAVL